MSDQTPQITPYQFEGIQKLTRHQVQLESTLLNYIPYASSTQAVSETLEKFLFQQFNVPAKISLEKIQESNLTTLAQSLPPFSLVLTLGVQPLTSKAYAWIDPVLAFSLIDRVLGGPGQLPTELKPLTPIEEGVFQYLALKTLNELFELFHDSNPVHLRLEQIYQSRKEFSKTVEENLETVQLHFRVQVGACNGFVTLVFPHPFLEEVFLNRDPLEQPEKTSDYECSLQRFEQMGYVHTSVWLEIGQVQLSLQEKNQLEKGDIILFDQTDLGLVEGRLAGKALLKLGEGKTGGFLTQIISSDNPALVKIIGYHGGLYGP